jgi:hypothetical protein
VDHAIGTDESFFPSLRGDETSVKYEGNRLGDEFVEVLDSDLDEVVFIYLDGNRIPILRMKPEGGQPVAESSFAGEVVILEAKVLGIVGIAWLLQLLQQLGSIPTVDDLPAEQEEDGNRVEGSPSPGGGPAETLGQNVTEGTEVDQAEQEVEIGEMLPICPLFEVLETLIDIVRTICLLGRERDIVGERPAEWQAVTQAVEATLSNKNSILSTGLGRCESGIKHDALLASATNGLPPAPLPRTPPSCDGPGDCAVDRNAQDDASRPMLRCAVGVPALR